jgi:ABC-type protease/lipase transport system fused ATPase/permease subunit
MKQMKDRNKLSINLLPWALASTLFLLILKVYFVVDIGWWIVFSPILFVLAFVIGVLSVVAIVFLHALKNGQNISVKWNKNKDE